MATLTPEQIGKYAWNAGFGRDAPTLARAIAVAMAESGGRTDAHNGNAGTGDNSYGLWQINMIGSMGPARRKQFGISSNEALFDPQTNANAAWKVSNEGRNWTPWSVFKNGTYTKHIPAAEQAAKAVIAGTGGVANFAYNMPGADLARGLGQQVGEATSGLDIGGRITASVNALTGSMFKAGINVGAVLLALLLLGLGVAILMYRPIKKATQGVAKVAGVVAPQGRVATVASKAGKVMP
jgi:hypothetical protein